MSFIRAPCSFIARIDVVRQDGSYVCSHVGDWPELTPGYSWLKVMLNSLHCPVCALTLVRREAHEKCGLYDPAGGFIADVEMWMRLSGQGDVAYVAEPLIAVREREHRIILRPRHGRRCCALPLESTGNISRERSLDRGDG